MKPQLNLPKRLMIVVPYKECGILELRNYFLDNEWDVTFLAPNQKHSYQGGRSVLLLPDTGGINANTSYFLKESALPPNVPSQDQALEYFRLNTLSWYRTKQEQGKGTIGILGIGCSAFLTFAELCKGSLFKKGNSLEFGATPVNMECNKDFFHDVPNRIAGLVNPDFEQILRMANLLVKKRDGGVTVTVPNTPPSPIKKLL